MSKLYFRYGAMNCGKSTHLLQVAYNYEEQNMKVVLIKPSIDNKGKDNILSRLGATRKVDYLINKTDSIIDLIDLKNINCILVDEVQFLTSKQIDELFKITILYHIPVICYGLRTDFKGNGFEGSQRLLLLAHEIEEMKTICKCGKKAIFNARKINNKFIFDGNQIEIDNNTQVQYESLCGQCYLKYKEQNINSKI